VHVCVTYTGQSLESVLATLKTRHQPVLKAVLKKYKQYSACTRLLDTAYFKRFVGRVPLWSKTPLHRGVSTAVDSPDFRRWMKALLGIES